MHSWTLREKTRSLPFDGKQLLKYHLEVEVTHRYLNYVGYTDCEGENLVYGETAFSVFGNYRLLGGGEFANMVLRDVDLSS